jgi:hypothetical protein
VLSSATRFQNGIIGGVQNRFAKIRKSRKAGIHPMLQKFIAAAAWACLIFIAYATLSSAGQRPELTVSEPMLAVFVERFGAYGLLGVLFRLAYPSRVGLVWLLVLASAVVLELLQIVIPDRDARLIDAAEKLAGGATGILAARTFPSFAGHRDWKM